MSSKFSIWAVTTMVVWCLSWHSTHVLTAFVALLKTIWLAPLSYMLSRFHGSEFLDMLIDGLYSYYRPVATEISSFLIWSQLMLLHSTPTSEHRPIYQHFCWILYTAGLELTSQALSTRSRMIVQYDTSRSALSVKWTLLRAAQRRSWTHTVHDQDSSSFRYLSNRRS